ncbi:MAG: biliverdin-producing heme oxygenase [Pseudomonadota bacterium]|uniref:biliverdin-producing heme oxygenase n=1 Tax=Rhizorhabdus phycosphaerae TaxID=2711156 RepID=UPI0013ECCF49|nr:biliverdin-producing heme oxygenase [Rhizorhabdus phycosphaerae]
MAVAPLQPLFAGFTKRHLGVSVPDYPALLRDDLTAIGIAPDLLPQLDVDGIDERAAGYVVAGSRLGMSMIRRRGYWHAEPAGRSSYMDDDQGIVVWRHLLKWFAEQRADQAEAEIICEAARRCFDLFKKAFAMSEGAKG